MRTIACIAFMVLYWNLSSMGQNLNKYQVNVAKAAPAYIKFKDKIKNAEFSTTTAYDNYQIRVRNYDNTLIVQYVGADAKPVDEGLTILEGSRSHFLIVSFFPDYDINKHPQLSFKLDDLKLLKSLVSKQEQQVNLSDAERTAALQKQKAEEAAEQQQALAQAEKERNAQEAERKKALEAERKKETEKEKSDKAALAKAEQERVSAEKEKKKLEQERAAALKKEQALEAEKERIAKQNIDEAKRIRLEQEKQAAIDKLQQERLVKEQKEQAAKEKLAAIQEQKTVLEAAKKKKEQDSKYSTIGLWNRYGKHGINLYEIPEQQKNWINADFFLSQDTLFNYQSSQEILSKADREIAATYGAFKSGVSIAVKDVQFKGPFTYYKIKIDNNTDEDFLTGAVVVQIYDKDKAHKQELKCSYFTYIGFYPIVKPHEQHYVVLATRTPVIDNEDNVVVYMHERREDKGSAFALMEGTVINKELGKIEKVITKSSPVEKEGKKKKKKKDKS